MYSFRKYFKKALVLMLCLGSCLLSTSCSGASETSTNTSSKENLKVGVLLDENGQQYAAGKSLKIAMELAAEDINLFLQKNGFSKQVKLYFEDTQGEPQIAAKKIKSFKTEEIIPVFCGSSEEIEAISGYAQQNNHLLLSAFSTATSLAENNDNLFRFCMNDSEQAKAIVRYAQENGVKSIVLVYRDDIYGNDLKTKVMDLGLEFGIDIDQEIKYNPDETNYASIVGSIQQSVKREKSENPENSVAVLLISMNEVSDIFASAAGNAELESVKWIGGDGVDANVRIFKEKAALHFAEKTEFTVCNFGIDLSGYIKEPFIDVPDRIKEKAGTDKIPAVAYYYYDAMWVLAESWLNSAEIDFDLLKENIPMVSHVFSVCTGQIGLDEYGDRQWGRYDFWQVEKGEFKYSSAILFGTWTDEGVYSVE